MSLVDPKLPKKYKNQKVLFEQNLDAWRKATEAALALINLNLTQVGKDLNGNIYDFNNAGNQSIFPDIQTQINNIISGATPITGTASDTWSINTDGNTAILDTINLTATRNFFFPDISGTFVVTEGNQTVNGVKTFTSNIPFKSGTAFDGIFDHTNTANRTWTLPDVTGNIPVLPNPAITETGSGAIVRQISPTITTPIIADFTTSQHSHQNAAGGGSLDAAAIAAGILPVVRGGTGVNVSTGTVAVVLSNSPSLVTPSMTTPTIASNEFSNAQHDHSDAAHGGIISASSIDHGGLGGLADDDHPQYAAIAQNENISGLWDFPSAGGAPTANKLYRQGYAQAGLDYRDNVGIIVDFNIDTVTDLATAGAYDIAVDTDFSSAAIIVVGCASDPEGNPAGAGESYEFDVYDKATTGFSVSILDDQSGVFEDDDFNVMAWGPQ